LTRSHHLAHRFAGTLVRAGRSSALALVLTAGLAGCRHKTVRFVIPQGAQVPIELATIPPPEPPPEIATLPPPEMSPLSPPEPPKPAPRRRPTPAPKEEAQPPVQVTSDTSSAALAIGALSTGGDAMSQAHQQTQDMITSIRKRIAALPAKTSDAQKKQLSQVGRFLDQAQQALNSGDAEAAQNLAIKARLLMDDLEKK
jgi:hypothetical protein